MPSAGGSLTKRPRLSPPDQHAVRADGAVVFVPDRVNPTPLQVMPTLRYRWGYGPRSFSKQIFARTWQIIERARGGGCSGTVVSATDRAASAAVLCSQGVVLSQSSSTDVVVLVGCRLAGGGREGPA